jgi:hypothetical protein
LAGVGWVLARGHATDLDLSVREPTRPPARAADGEKAAAAGGGGGREARRTEAAAAAD